MRIIPPSYHPAIRASIEDRGWKIAQLAAILAAGSMQVRGSTFIQDHEHVSDAAAILDVAERHVLTEYNAQHGEPNGTA